MCYLFSLFWEGSSNKTIPSISRVSYFPLATLLYPRLSSSLILPIFPPNLPSSSRQQIEAVPVPLRFGLVLAPGAQKLKPFQGWEATNRRGFGAQSFVSRGEKVFCIQSWALLLILLNRNRLLCVGKPDLVHRYGFEICERVDEQDRVRFLFLLIAPSLPCKIRFFIGFFTSRRNS